MPQIVETDIVLSDITTNNADANKHGLMPKLPNDATKFLDGLGAWSLAGISTDPLVVVGAIEMTAFNSIYMGVEKNQALTGYGPASVLLQAGDITNQVDAYSYAQVASDLVSLWTQNDGDVLDAEINITPGRIRLYGTGSVVKFEIDTTGIGFFAKTPAAQQALIVDPIDLATALAAIADINALLKAYGLEAAV